MIDFGAKKIAFGNWIAGGPITDTNLEIVISSLKDTMETIEAIEGRTLTWKALHSHWYHATMIQENRKGK